MPSSLQLVILYDARRNVYTVCDHNLSAEEAAKEVARWGKDLLPAFIVNQRARHRTSDPQLCRACRRDVRRSAGLTPSPHFERRHSK